MLGCFMKPDHSTSLDPTGCCTHRQTVTVQYFVPPPSFLLFSLLNISKVHCDRRSDKGREITAKDLLCGKSNTDIISIPEVPPIVVFFFHLLDLHWGGFAPRGDGDPDHNPEAPGPEGAKAAGRKKKFVTIYMCNFRVCVRIYIFSMYFRTTGTTWSVRQSCPPHPHPPRIQALPTSTLTPVWRM